MRNSRTRTPSQRTPAQKEAPAAGKINAAASRTAESQKPAAGEPQEPDAPELGAVLAALADPHRRKVIHDLVNDRVSSERSCVSFGLPVSKSTLSHHFKVLREAGLVRQVDHGNRSGVTLRREELDERFPGLLALIGTQA